MAEIKIRWPFGGLNKNQSFTDQAPDTSRDLLNCRGLDPLTGRLRGAQRSGLLALGLTSGEVCTNLLQDPETLDTTQTPGDDVWTNSGSLNETAAVSPVQANPFGETTPNPAIRLVTAGAAGVAELKQSLTDNTWAAQQVISIYIKRPTTGSSQTDDFEMGFQTGASLVISTFTISGAGAVALASEDTFPVAGYTVSNSAATLVANGWYRVSIAVATANTGVDRDAYFAFNRGTADVEDLWAWGAQLCEGQLTLPAYRAGSIASGEKIQWIEPIVVDDRKITWAKNSPGTSITTTNGQFGVAFGVDGYGGDMQYDPVQGRLYVQIADNRIGEYDKTGNILDTIEVPNPPEASGGAGATTQIIQFDPDAAGNLFVTIGIEPGEIAGSGGSIPAGDPPKTDDNESICRTYRLSRDTSGDWYIVWTIFHNQSYPTAIKIRNGKMYLARYKPDASSADSGGPAFSVYTNIYTATPSNFPAVATTISGETTSDIRLHGIDVNDNGLVLVTGANKGQTDSGIYILDSSTGTTLGSVTDEIGMGLGCKFDTNAFCYAVGFDTVNGSDIRRYSVSTAGVIAATMTTAPASSGILGQTYQARIDVDKFNNVWVPYQASGGTDAVLEGIDSSGTSVATFAGTASSANGGWAAAVDTDIPNYRDTTTLWPEHVWLSSHLTYKVNFATPTVTSGSPRTQTNVVVAGGLVKTFTVDDWTATPPTVSVMAPNDSSSGAMQTVDFIQAATLFNKVFFVDGESYRVYDPKNIENSSFGELTDYEATKGIIPPRCKLISSWRGRIVLARGDNEQEWFMSGQSDPFNYLFFPPVSSATQAIQGSLARAGLVPDVTNGIIPYTDDLLIMGGDHSMWRFTGDPAAGGQIDLISDITGMAFGKAWTKDPNGIIYFFGSRGGVYRMSPESLPERITYGSIERDLQDLDLAANYIRLVWNYRDEGLHVFQIPYGAVTEQLDHWFWEQKSGGWYKDNFYDTSAVSNQPTAAAVVDGDDPNDRRLLLGGGGNTSLSSGDGYVAAWDADTFTDTGTAIYSKALIGPFQSDDKEVRMTSFSPVLASDQGGADYRLYVTPAADTLSGQVFNGTMQSGRNPRLRLRGRGSHIFLEISDASINRWAFETATVEVYPAGRQRVRAN